MIPPIEYQGFLRFIARANKEFVNWFGPHCRYDASKINFMAIREWDGMSDDEKQFFIKAQKLNSRSGEKRAPSGENPFLCYLLLKRYNTFPSIHGTNQPFTRSLFHPQSAKYHSEDWKALPKQERQQYAGIRLSELGIEHVIEKRDQLHQLYDPKELTILEFILKTKPKKPLSAHSWFLAKESLSINSIAARERWLNIEQDKKTFYNQCAWLDKKRFSFEKDAWMTNLLTIDFSGDNFTLADFDSEHVKFNLEKIVSIIEQRKDLIPTPDEVRRPLSPFSLFIREYRNQNKHLEFRFGRHLQDSAAAWAKLSEKEKQVFKEESKKLRDSFKKDQLVSCDDTQLSKLKLTADLFKHSKSLNGPTRPSHLITRVPTVIDLFGRRNNIKRNDRAKAWEALPTQEKEQYIKEYKSIKNSIETDNETVKRKIEQVKELLSKAKDLEQLKKDLFLLRNRKKTVKESIL